MIYNTRIIVCLGVISSILLLWFLFPQNRQKQKQKEKTIFVCTTSIIADAVKSIAHDTIDLYCLMGPGVDPHLYRPTQKDMQLLSMADVILYNGLCLEGKMSDLFSYMQQIKPTYAVADSLDKHKLLSAENHATYDPHIWHDVQCWIEVVEYISTILQKHAPQHEKFYKAQRDSYKSLLQELHTYVHNEIQKIPKEQRILVTAHDAFRYFGVSYGMHVVGLQGTSTDSEISTRTMQDLADFIVQHKLKAIFVESSVPHRSIQAVQQAVRARNWNVVIGMDLYSDALADDKNKDEMTYCGMIRHNVHAIVSALR